MEAIVLCGLQGSGKTTLCRERFAEHVRVSLDELGSRAREAALLEECLGDGRPFAVDNTNPTAADRARYVAPARAAGFRVIGYVVDAGAAEAFARNAGREGIARIPPGNVAATARRFVTPTLEEGFDELWHATAAPGGGWRIDPLLTTPPLF
jgi:predicted kinase